LRLLFLAAGANKETGRLCVAAVIPAHRVISGPFQAFQISTAGAGKASGRALQERKSTVEETDARKFRGQWMAPLPPFKNMHGRYGIVVDGAARSGSGSRPR
jgi:hypothetical protein